MYATQAAAASPPIQFQARTHPRYTTCTMGVATEKRPPSLYDVLRLNRSASPAQIKASYRSLAKQFHPDTNNSKSGSSDFIEIQNAYETLSDPVDRARYDLSFSLVGRVGLRRAGESDFVGYYHHTRRWETDQCW